MGWFRIRSCSLKPMDFFDIHTHNITLCPERELVSYDVQLALPEVDVVYVSVGIHPWTLTEGNAERGLQLLHEALRDSRVIAIGEVGLDKLKGPSMEVQMSVFRRVVGLAEERCYPLVIHCVRAFNELLQVKKDLKPSQPWIIHGYRGKGTVAQELIKQGFYLSFGSKFQEQALCEVPLNRLFIETDESPEDIQEVYCKVAKARNLSVEELAEAVKQNVQEVFFKH